MAEDLSLIQYVRDNFGEEYVLENYNMVDDDLYCALDLNTFTESTGTFHSSPNTAAVVPQAAVSNNPDTFVPSLFGSPSPLVKEGGPAMEQCFPNSLQGQRPFFSNPPLDAEYPLLAAYGLSQRPVPVLDDFHPSSSLHNQAGFEENLLQELRVVESQSAAAAAAAAAANCTLAASTSACISASSTEGERTTTSSFWRGKSPALLMQQLRGPSLSASSSSSEARSTIRPSPSSHQPSFLQSTSATLGPTPLNVSRLATGVANIEPVSRLSKSAPGLSDYTGFSLQLPAAVLGTDNMDTYRGQLAGQRILRSASFNDPGLVGNRVKVGMGSSISQLKQGGNGNVMPGSTVLEEMRNAGTAGLQSGNNSWSSSTSPGPSYSNLDQDAEVCPTWPIDHLINREDSSGHRYSMSLDRHELGGDHCRAWKKAKGAAAVAAAASQGAVQSAANFAHAMVEQTEKKQLQEKFLALLQVDSSTSKDSKAQILDDTIRYLKGLRRRLDVNEADSNFEGLRLSDIASRGSFRAEKNMEASPAGTSSRSWKFGEGSSSPIHLEDLELETAGVEISPHLTVENGPQIEVRMMENQYVMVKLVAKDRPGLFNDIMMVLRSLRLDIQHANIRTGSNGHRHDIFAVKMQLPFFSSQSTHSIAIALNQAIGGSGTPSLASTEPHTPQI